MQLLLILDLDETLIFATESPLSRVSDFRVGTHHIYKRPYLDAFIETCARQFEMAVWTSASESYGTEVVQHLFPSHIDPKFVWTRNRCVRKFDGDRFEYQWIKDLKKVKRLGYHLERVRVARAV